jgi:hypothetical protein
VLHSGTGGHLHNLGVILKPAQRAAEDIAESAADTVVREKLLQLASAHSLHTCGLLCQYTGQKPSAGLQRHWALGRLIGTRSSSVASFSLFTAS